MAVTSSGARDTAGERRWRAWLVVGLLGGVFLAVWGWTRGASLTHDEVVYVDVARHLLTSDYYPGDLFLRHPPLGLGLLGAWQALGLPLRAWAVPWSLAGIALVAAGLREREAPIWALAPLVVALAVLALVSVTMYPPLLAFLGLAAYGWARRSRWLEAIGWNLAVLTHELALLVLAFRLAPRALAYLRRGETSASRWAGLVWPYPGAVAWGLVMIAGLVHGGDPRGGLVATVVDPSPNALTVMSLKPMIGLFMAAVLAPLVRWPTRGAHPARGLAVAAGVAVIAAPFHRYLVALLPLVIVTAGAVEPRWLDDRWPTLALAGALLAGGGVLATTVQGVDTLNAADVPGLVDHRSGASLLEPDETAVVRSPVSFAHVLRDDGWTLAGTGEVAPSEVHLTRDGSRIVLLRAETTARLVELTGQHEVDAALIPATWETVIASLEGSGWTPGQTQGNLMRLEAPGPPASRA